MSRYYDDGEDDGMRHSGLVPTAAEKRMDDYIQKLKRERDNYSAEMGLADKEVFRLRKAIEDALDKCKSEYPQPFSNLREIADILRKALEVTK